MVASEHMGHFGRCRVHPSRRYVLRIEVGEAREWTIGIVWQLYARTSTVAVAGDLAVCVAMPRRALEWMKRDASACSFGVLCVAGVNAS